MRLHLQGQSWPTDVLRGSRGRCFHLRGQWPVQWGVVFVVVDVDYVHIDDVNYDQTKPHGSRRSNDAGENHWFDSSLEKKRKKTLTRTLVWLTASLASCPYRKLARSWRCAGVRWEEILSQKSSLYILARLKRAMQVVAHTAVVLTCHQWDILMLCCQQVANT